VPHPRPLLADALRGEMHAWLSGAEPRDGEERLALMAAYGAGASAMGALVTDRLAASRSEGGVSL